MARFTVAALAPPMSFAEIALGNGIHLHYARQGPADGPVIILLHGYSDSSFSFSRVMPLLPPELRVIAPDLRGHGHSARPVNGYRIGDLAGDVLRMMDLMSIPEALTVGHSMGSFVAQAIAIVGIVLAIATGTGNIFSAPEYAFGSDGRTWTHVASHLFIGTTVGSLVAWGIGSLVLFITKRSKA